MSFELTFEVNGLPKLPNLLLGAHWRTRSHHANVWKGRVKEALMFSIPKKPLEKAELELVRCSSGTCDYDGLVGSFKPILDALVRFGVIKNDTMEVIGVPVYRHEKALAGKGRIRVTIRGAV